MTFGKMIQSIDFRCEHGAKNGLFCLHHFKLLHCCVQIEHDCHCSKNSNADDYFSTIFHDFEWLKQNWKLKQVWSSTRMMLINYNLRSLSEAMTSFQMIQIESFQVFFLIIQELWSVHQFFSHTLSSRNFSRNKAMQLSARRPSSSSSASGIRQKIESWLTNILNCSRSRVFKRRYCAFSFSSIFEFFMK